MDGLFGLPVRAAIRIFIFIFSVVDIGLFAADISSVSPSETLTNHIFALVAGVLSTLTCAYHCLATVTHGAWYTWDFVLSVLWAAVAGTFGTLLFRRGSSDDRPGIPADESRRGQLTAAVALAVCCLVLYLLVTIHGCAWCCASRSRRRQEKDAKEDVQLEEFGPRERREVA